MLALGIESESEEVRKEYNARTPRASENPDRLPEHAAGWVRSFAFFIFGYPGETPQTMEATTRYAIELDPDFANFYPAVHAYKYCALRQVRPGRLADPDRRRLDEDGVFGTTCFAGTVSTNEWSSTPSIARNAASFCVRPTLPAISAMSPAWP